MDNFWTVFFSNYRTKIKSKSFLTFTILFTLIIIGLMFSDKIMNLFQPDSKPVGVVTSDNELKEIVGQMTEDQLISGGHEHEIMYFSNKKDAEEKLADDQLAYFLTIDRNTDRTLLVTFIAETDVHDEDVASVQSIFSQIQSYLMAQDIQLSDEEFLRVLSPAEIVVEKMSSNLKDEENHLSTGFLIILFISLNYILILSYATQLATAVATEKSSRVMELIISSISPTKYLFAKLLSTLFVGLTQVAVWLLVPYLLYKLNIINIDDSLSSFINLSSLDTEMIGLGIIFFVLGFLLYGSLACLFGSLMSRSEESSQAVMPLMILLLIGFYIGIFGLYNPSSTFITVTSHIPFFTPIIMLVRVGFLNISFLEIFISLLTLSLLTVATIFVTARVFKGGVFLYGKGSFKNIKKALDVHQN